MSDNVDAEQKRRGRPASGTKTHSAGYILLMTRARELQLDSVRGWCRLVLDNELPTPLPARPELEFPEKFEDDPAAAWQEFLGLSHKPTSSELELLPDVDQRGYVEFEYATEMAKTLELQTVEDWYRKAGDLHPCCPREPWAVYFNKGYTSLEAFIGLPEPSEA
jgi:hypothetical protein